MSDYDENEERNDEEVEEKRPEINYDEVDSETGFKVVEKKIWDAFTAWRATPEEERDPADEAAWIEKFAEDNYYDINRVKTVVTLGIYAGQRDVFNQRHGEGRTIYSNNDEYTGQYLEGKRSGEGVYKFISQGASNIEKEIHERWKQAIQNTEEEPSLQEFCRECKSSMGVHEILVETSIEHGPYPCYYGHWEANKKSGRGTFKYKDGGVYSGDWFENKRHGTGYYYYPNGDVYKGKWANGQKHGEGIYEFAVPSSQGVSLSGTWENGHLKSGTWKLSGDPNPIEYHGTFVNNLPRGENGTFVFDKLGIQQTGVFDDNSKWNPSFYLNRMMAESN